MRAIGNNLVIKKIEKPNETTKGGLILSEKQREDVRFQKAEVIKVCLLYTSPSPRDRQKSRMPSSA